MGKEEKREREAQSKAIMQKLRQRWIPDDVKIFGQPYENFKKENKGCLKKKEMKEVYLMEKLEYFGKSLDWLIKNFNNQKQETKDVVGICLAQFCDPEQPELNEKLYKMIKKDKDELEYIENLEYAPILFWDIMNDALKYKEQIPEEKFVFIEKSLQAICHEIVKKRMKKLSKKGIADELAYDLLLIMPKKDALKYGRYMRARMLIDMLYFYAKKGFTVDVPLIMKELVAEEDYSIVISYALQERKDKTKGFTEVQMKTWVEITEWCFNVMENDYDDHDTYEIILNYVKLRKKDASQGKDGNRRYFLSSLPKDEYPVITNIIERICNNDQQAKKYL